MPLRRSQGAMRPETPRPDELPPCPPAAITVADRDPRTGRFVRENGAARRRKLKTAARQLAGLDPAKCAPWLAPFAMLAAKHATAIIAELPGQSAAVNALAVDTAQALAVYRGLLALGSTGDVKALAEARAWMREHRQNLITLTALARELARDDDDGPPPWEVTEAPPSADVASGRVRVAGATAETEDEESGAYGAAEGQDNG